MITIIALSDHQPRFTSLERTVLTQIFIDTENALKLYGYRISKHLNDNVMHEAVTYVHDTATKTVPCLDFLVSGAGTGQGLSLRPSVLSLGGDLSIGKQHKGKAVKMLLGPVILSFIILYYVILCYNMLYYVLFCSVLFCSVLFCPVLFCSVLFCSVL